MIFFIEPLPSENKQDNRNSECGTKIPDNSKSEPNIFFVSIFFRATLHIKMLNLVNYTEQRKKGQSFSFFKDATIMRSYMNFVNFLYVDKFGLI